MITIVVLAIIGTLLILSIGFNIGMWVYFYKARIKSLSKSIQDIEKDFKPLIDQMKSMSHDIYPTPNLVTIIEETVQDHLRIELALTKDNKTKFGKEMLTKITINTQKTFPYVNQQYLVEKVISMVQNMIGPLPTTEEKDDE